jgi:histidinol phosphatase-like enzyme
VFLDLDGTITSPRHYPARPSDLVLQPSIGEPLRSVQDDGVALVVVTNQSGLARGLFDEAALDAMQAAETGRLRIFDDSLTAARDYLPVDAVAATLVYFARIPVPPGTYKLGGPIS